MFVATYNRCYQYHQVYILVRECSFEVLGGGAGKRGGMQIPYWIWGGPSKFRIGFGGGHVNSAYVEKKPVMLHFQIIIYLLNNQINYFIYSIRYFSVSVQYSTGTPFRYCVERGEV